MVASRALAPAQPHRLYIFRGTLERRGTVAAECSPKTRLNATVVGYGERARTVQDAGLPPDNN